MTQSERGEGLCSFLLTVFVGNQNMEGISVEMLQCSVWKCICHRETWYVLMRYYCPRRHHPNRECLKMSTEYYFSCIYGWLRLGLIGWLFRVGLAMPQIGYMGLEYSRWFFFRWPLGWLSSLCVTSGLSLPCSIPSQPDLYDSCLFFCRLLVCICWGQGLAI